MSDGSLTFARTVPTLVEAMQFVNEASGRALVDWVDSTRGAGWHPIARYDPHQNRVFVPSLTGPGCVEPGWWVVRLPSGRFVTYESGDFADQFELLGPAPFPAPRSVVRR